MTVTAATGTDDSTMVSVENKLLGYLALTVAEAAELSTALAEAAAS